MPWRPRTAVGRETTRPTGTGRPSRRTILLLGGATALLTACSPSGARGARPVERPGPDRTPPRDVVELLARPTFWVAHRGSGDNWPEHTLLAYRSALAAGADAVEISVCATSDGVLVCHHDTSGARVLGIDRAIGDMSWDELQGYPVDARRWLGPATSLEPVSRLDDVLAELGPDVLAFVEDKQGTNTSALLDLLDAQPRSRERFVWKQWAGAGQVGAATARGYAAWGYMDADHLERVDEFAQTFDVLGVPMGAADELAERAVATGLPVMAWEVHYHADVARLDRLGVAGRMCSNVPYLLGSQRSAVDSFASGARAAGDLPADHGSIGWAAQPALVPERGSLRVERSGQTSYLMGSMSDPAQQLASVEVTLTFPEATPSDGVVGVAVGLDGDGTGGDADRGAANGYEIALDARGLVTLHAREAGRTAELLAESEVPPFGVGVPVRLLVELDEDGVRATVDDVVVIEAADARWRGPWFRLVKGYETSQAVEFSTVAVTLRP